jgi:UDP-N-acetylmuramate: L-alanyl-gamma-D-glutamyl-meso-diaminopimelate ligase
MNPEDTHFYFMGICGTAMGSVAAALVERGYRVTGSDAKVYDPMKSFLEGRGIEILDGYRVENIPEDADYIVVGNAQSRGNVEVEALLNARRRYISLPEVLKDFFLRDRCNLVVSGTHGKTTTASMLAWLLQSAELSPNYMIGGIPRNFGQGARLGDSEFTVLEGDEYDTAFFDKRSKFIHYLPDFVVVNNIEFDHADIFDDVEQIKKSFEHMLRLVPSNGLICVNGDQQNCLDVVRRSHSPVKRVGFSEYCDVKIEDLKYGAGESSFSLEGERYSIPMDGEFNVRNAAMAVCGARFVGIEPDAVRKGLESFEGVARRQEIRGITKRGITVVDDFGHHPTAIREALIGMRRRFRESRVWAIFEPRSNTTRRSVFQQMLPDALSYADAVCISAVENLEKVPSEQRLDPARVMEDLHKLDKPAFYEPDADAIVERLKTEARDGDVIIVFSNGGFDGIHEKLLAAL